MRISNKMLFASTMLNGLTMADPATTTEPAAGGGESKPAKKEEPKTVANDMDSRRIFPNPAEAIAYLTQMGQTLSDFGDQTFASPGVDAEGNFDPAVYTDQMDVMVTVLTNRKDGKSKVHAIVVAPVPKIDSILSDESGRKWAERILHKELNHVAVRALRDASDVSTVVDQIPTTLTGYIESTRADAGIMETFNETYQAINKTMGGARPIWAKARLIKSDLRKALENRAFALEFFGSLEDYKGQSLFEAAIRLGINAAKRNGLDPTIYERWLATRNDKTFDSKATDDDEAELDIDSMAESLLADDAAPDATEQASGESEQQPDDAAKTDDAAE